MSKYKRSFSVDHRKPIFIDKKDPRSAKFDQYSSRLGRDLIQEDIPDIEKENPNWIRNFYVDKNVELQNFLNQFAIQGGGSHEMFSENSGVWAESKRFNTIVMNSKKEIFVKMNNGGTTLYYDETIDNFRFLNRNWQLLPGGNFPLLFEPLDEPTGPLPFFPSSLPLDVKYNSNGVPLNEQDIKSLQKAYNHTPMIVKLNTDGDILKAIFLAGIDRSSPSTMATDNTEEICCGIQAYALGNELGYGQFGSNGDTMFYGIDVDSEDNIIVYIEGGYLASFNSSLELNWVIRIDVESGPWAWPVIDRDNNIYVTSSGTDYTTEGLYKPYIILYKISKDGTVIFKKEMYSPPGDPDYENIFVNDTVFKNDLIYILAAWDGTGYENKLIVLDTDGNIVRQTHLYLDVEIYDMQNLSVDDYGNAYLFSRNGYPYNTYLSAAGITKVNTAGEIEWDKLFWSGPYNADPLLNQSGFYSGKKVELLKNGNLLALITGITYNPESEYWSREYYNLYGQEALTHSIFLELDQDGNIVKSHAIGASLIDGGSVYYVSYQGNAIYDFILDSEDNIYAIGFKEGDRSGPDLITERTYQQQPHGIFVAKLTTRFGEFGRYRVLPRTETQYSLDVSLPFTSGFNVPYSIPGAKNVSYISSGNIFPAKDDILLVVSSCLSGNISITDNQGLSWTTHNISGTPNVAYSYAVCTNSTAIQVYISSTSSTSIAGIVYRIAGTNIDNIVIDTAAIGSSTTPSITSNIDTSHGVIIGFVAVNGPSNDTFTRDSDTKYGSWNNTPVTSGTTGGSATTNITLRTQYKFIAAAGTQTYDPILGTSRDWVGLIVNVRSGLIVPKNPDLLKEYNISSNLIYYGDASIKEFFRDEGDTGNTTTPAGPFPEDYGNGAEVTIEDVSFNNAIMLEGIVREPYYKTKFVRF